MQKPKFEGIQCHLECPYMVVPGYMETICVAYDGESNGCWGLVSLSTSDYISYLRCQGCVEEFKELVENYKAKEE